jgi:hypothetical protein
MPEADKYTVKHRELVGLIIKQCEIHEGKWYLTVGFGIAPGNFGPSNDQLSPGTIVAVNQIGIARADDTTPPEMSVDAAEVNPLPKPKGREQK